jgi:pyruvate formate lyase activating enzyme
MDLKLLPSARHQEVTGRPNSRVLENARRLARTGVPMIFRTPVVPTVNDSDEEIGSIAAFIRSVADERASNGHAGAPPLWYELLPFHSLATDKYRSLGLESPSAALTPPSPDTMQRLRRVAEGRGISVRLP